MPRGLFDFLYYLGYLISRWIGLMRRKRLPVKVISIGNITAGGGGKTPAAIALCRELVKRGHRPCVLTRGYKGSLKGPVIVTPDMSAADSGDEPLLMASKMPDVPVIKCASRFMGGLFALDNVKPKPDVFILDDGYQHWGLHRDADILLINANDPFGNGRLLPMGMLREPLSQIKRADIIVITNSKGMDVMPIMERIKNYNDAAPVFTAEHRPLLVSASDGKEHNVAWLKSKKVFAFSAIAAPAAFVETVKNLGADIRGSRDFSDHYAYKKTDIDGLAGDAKACGADWLITTEKDIMKLKDVSMPRNLAALHVEFASGVEFYESAANAIGGAEGDR